MKELSFADRQTLRNSALALFVASCTVLLQELALIRWLPSQVRVLAYFPNLILLSAFVGLGIGCLTSGRRSLLWLWPLALTATVLAAVAANNIAFTQNSESEHLWLLYYDLPPGAPVVQGVRLPILTAFVLSALSFVGLGQVVAERLSVFQKFGRSLHGYAWDILGSVAGVAAFTFLGFNETFPVVWFAIFLGAGTIFVLRPRWLAVSYLCAAVLILGTVLWGERGMFYSPYYSLALQRESSFPGISLLTNGSWHQQALSLARARPAENETHAAVRDGYHLPYSLMNKPPRRALVIGAGTGNDVAVMLDQGVEAIDAVEIDPIILRLGRELAPDNPYASPRVRLFNTDARSFLNSSREQYDLIVFGTLDSMTHLSALSNVRLDNFVYTLQCIESARRRLTPSGGLALYFAVGTQYIHLRMMGMLTRVFGEVPLVDEKFHYLFNHVYMAGPAFAGQHGEQRRLLAERYERSTLPRSELPTDDWPYLYLSTRGISGFYLSLIAAIALLSFAAVTLTAPHMLRGLLAGRSWDVQMFLFGMAFMLLETRAVTAMNLLWGATWLTSAVVFGSILAMILAATLLSAWKPLRFSLAGFGLLAALLGAYFFPLSAALGHGPFVKLLVSLLCAGLPIFFAAICFAALFAARDRADLAFGWNLLGAVAGGLCEYLSMAVGFRALLLVAAVLYLAALWRSVSTSTSTSTST